MGTMDDNSTYEALDAILSAYHQLIRKVCWRYAQGSADLCDELVQECYLSIAVHHHELRPGAHRLQRMAWVAWQCRAAIVAWKRRGMPVYQPLDSHLADTLPAPDPSLGPEIIADLAADLGPVERKMLQLLLEGYSLREVAWQLDLGYEAAKKTHQRMITKMRKRYEHQSRT